MNDGFLIDFLNVRLQMDWTMLGMRAVSMGLPVQLILPMKHGNHIWPGDTPGRGVKRVLGWPDVLLALMIL
jgi:hypothetical protein